MHRRLAVWTALVLLVADVAAGQDTYRQTVVVTAAATPAELGTVTRSVTVITREQIAALPLPSIADLLRLASSIDVRARGERGVQTDFSVRGAGFGQMLVLIDGIRINDAQSGHHNGDIPVPLDAIERVEVMYGPGSSLFGADAFGGTVNVITRHGAAPPTITVGGGSFASASCADRPAWRTSADRSRGGSFDRSGGFIDGRDFKTAMVGSRTGFGPATTVSVTYLWKEFGARNFYGAASTGDAFSREWTDQTLVAADHAFGMAAGWTMKGNASYAPTATNFSSRRGRRRASTARTKRSAPWLPRTAFRTVAP